MATRPKSLKAPVITDNPLTAEDRPQPMTNTPAPVNAPPVPSEPERFYAYDPNAPAPVTQPGQYQTVASTTGAGSPIVTYPQVPATGIPGGPTPPATPYASQSYPLAQPPAAPQMNTPTAAQLRGDAGSYAGMTPGAYTPYPAPLPKASAVAFNDQGDYAFQMGSGTPQASPTAQPAAQSSQNLSIPKAYAGYTYDDAKGIYRGGAVGNAIGVKYKTEWTAEELEKRGLKPTTGYSYGRDKSGKLITLPGDDDKNDRNTKAHTTRKRVTTDNSTRGRKKK